MFFWHVIETQGQTNKLLWCIHTWCVVVNENLGGILGVTQCEMGDSLMLSEC
jgi:hypothetical protein